MRKAILHLKKADPVMRAIIERVGAYKIEHREPSFETLVRSIVYQQLSGKVAVGDPGAADRAVAGRQGHAGADLEAYPGPHAQSRAFQTKDRLHSRPGAQNQ